MNDGRGYKIPAEPNPGMFRCVKLWIPDDDFYLFALGGAYQFLTTWVAWEKDGTTRAKQAAQAWKEAAAITYLHGWECPFDPNDPGSIDDWIVESDDVAININVDCCCGGGSNTLVCIDTDGNPIPTPQPPPSPILDPPPGVDDWPVDPQTDPVPDDFEDWTEFEDRACEVSNSLWEIAYWMAVAAEGAADVIATAGAVIVFLLGILPGSVTAAIGGVSLMEMVEALVQIIVGEQATDILLEVKDYLETEKEEIVCLIFSYRYNLPGFRAEFTANAINYVAQTVTLDDAEAASLRRFLDSLFPLSLLYEYFYTAGVLVAASDPIDCANCMPSYDWQVPAVPDDFETVQAYFTWTADRQTFIAQNCPSPDGSDYGIFFNPRNLAQHLTEVITLNRAEVDAAGVDSADTIEVQRISFDLYIGTSYAPKQFFVRVYDDVAGQTDIDLLTGLGTGEWHHLDFDVSGTLAGSQGNITVIQLVGFWNNNGDTVPAPTNQVFIDNLQVFGVVV